MIPTQSFHCPHCGAPGQVNMGQAEYSCLCRISAPVKTERKHDYVASRCWCGEANHPKHSARETPGEPK